MTHSYRVTIDTTKDQFEYEVDGASTEHAEEQALMLAEGDGLDPHRMKWVKSECLG